MRLTADVRQNQTMKRTPPAVRIRNADSSFVSRLGEAAGFFRKEENDAVFYSALGDGNSVSAHLVWLHGMLQHHARSLKRVREEGADILVEIYSEARDLAIEPNAILLPHKLGIPIEIRFRIKK